MKQNSTEENNIRSIITFEMADQKYCLNFDDVVVIVDPEQIERDSISDTSDPHITIGIFKVPVVDLCKIFGAEPIKKSDTNRIIVIEIFQKLFGFMVQRIMDVINVDRKESQAMEIFQQKELPYILKTVKYRGDKMFCLDLNQIFLGEKK